MTCKIVTYNPQKPVNADFYIQSKGNHAGRPLEKPKPNCFAVYTDQSYLFELVYSLYLAKAFDYYIIGSVIPFIRLPDVKKVIAAGVENFKPERLKYLKMIENVDRSLKQQEEHTAKLKELKIALALSIIKV